MTRTAATVGIASAGSIVVGACLAGLAGRFPAYAGTLEMCAGIIVTAGLTALGAALLPIFDLLSTRGDR